MKPIQDINFAREFVQKNIKKSPTAGDLIMAKKKTASKIMIIRLVEF